MSITAFIPARGGSKRIPRKNLQMLGGKPLIQYPIDLAKRVCNRVVVSTDDDEIAMCARFSGVEVSLRPPSMATDDITLDQLIGNWLTNDLVEEGLIVVLLPTCPFVGENWLRFAMRSAFVCNAPMLAGVRVHETYWYKRSGGRQSRVEERNNSQGAKEAYLESGAFSIFKPEWFRIRMTRRPSFARIAPVDKLSAFDIDDAWDLEIAQALVPFYERTAEETRRRLDA